MEFITQLKKLWKEYRETEGRIKVTKISETIPDIEFDPADFVAFMDWLIAKKVNKKKNGNSKKTKKK